SAAGASSATASATGVSTVSSAAASVTSAGVSSAGVSSAGASSVVFSSSAISDLPQSFTLVLHGQDAGDLALRRAQPGAVLERAGVRLEAEVEELAPGLAHLLLELLVRHVTKVSSSQRDQPPAA